MGRQRSVHATPRLLHALVGPILIALIAAGLVAVAGAPAWLSVLLGSAVLGTLSWSPLSLRGRAIAIHDSGLVITDSRGRSVVRFEDVDEVWFEIPAFQGSSGAYLRSIRLFDFSGAAHHVPLMVNDALALLQAILHECSQPVFLDAQKALREGRTLAFGKVQLDSSGIRIGGTQASWREVRLCLLDHGKVLLYRRMPLLAWRKVSLASVPHPTVFLGLVVQNVGNSRIDNSLILPLGVSPPTEVGKALASRSVLIGVAWLAIGLFVTLATHMADSGFYVVAVGPIVYGGVRIAQGLLAYLGSKR